MHLPLELSMPSEWLPGALFLAWFSALVVVGVFYYLSRFTEKPYFRLWTYGWFFYSLYLVTALLLEYLPGNDLLVMLRCASVGISALFMFWGSFQLTDHKRSPRELALAIVMMLFWSYVAVYRVAEPVYVMTPVFALLAAASVYTGWLYRRGRDRFHAAVLLASGFVFWGCYLMSFPFLPYWRGASAVVYLLSAGVAVYITLGMVVQVLHEERERHEGLLGEINQGVARSRLLEHEITVTEQKYRELFDSASDAYFLVDLETLEIAEANRAAKQLFSPLEENLIGRSFCDLCPDLDPRGKGLLDNKKAFDELFQPFHGVRVVRSDRREVPCEGEARLVETNKRPVMQVNMREVTARQQLEQQLRRADKLSALGGLVAGVAHELNNPLAVISGFSQLLSKRSGLDDTTRGELRKIFHESERAAKIVRNLLTFARPHEPEMQVVDLGVLIDNVLEIHDPEFRTFQIKVVKEFAPGLPRTKADPHQVEQVITNLITNAVHAQANQPGERLLAVGTENLGTALRITVADNGPGISAEHLPKIFEPFFTTKSPGQGTGLGLAICHAIVEAHHGRIYVQTEPGQGARFMVELPAHRVTEAAVAAPATAAVAGTAGLAAPPQASQQRILLVDDEPGILEVMKEILGMSGYLIDTATNGVTAMARVTGERYDLIISDLRMPDMDGEQLYHAIKERDAELARRIIFLTGDTVSTNARTFLEWTGNRWFSKPFNVAAIEEVVHNFLAETDPAPAAGAR